MQIIITSTILLSLLHPIGASIYLFDTHDGSNIEHFDCLDIDSFPYCRRPRFPINLTRNDGHFSCQQTNGGILHRFSTLRANNVSISTVLHRWRSSVEQVEAYARYLRERSGSDGYLCECQHGSGFGKSCEYQLPSGATSQETLDWQVMMKNTNQWEFQVYGKITCYEGISCDSGLLCLDWREICDGTQNCMFGLDEENCDILEMNICDDDEYRCSNGMCIPEQYFLDGEVDCLDGTDERWASINTKCAQKRVNARCDDRICLRNRWSCGDGNCIWERLAFQTHTFKYACISRRDQYFMCETHYVTVMWTMPNGRCNGAENHVADPLNEPTEKEDCEYLLKCALSLGGEKNCPCQRLSGECPKELQKRCPKKIIQYPKGAFMAPFLFFLFNTSQLSTSSLPHYILINGTVKCRHHLVNVTTTIGYKLYTQINHIIDAFMCNEEKSLDPANWNQSADQCFRANETSDMCRGWNPCLSVTRIKDGSQDCVDAQDENKHTNEDIEKSCARVQRHRFRCSPDQLACLRSEALGDSWEDCENGYDEIWPGTNRRFFSVKCNDLVREECSLVRQYIEQSPMLLQKNETRTMVRVPFRSYCDTFRDLESGEDENQVECQRWWKCPRPQLSCAAGQCIDEEWIDDEEWDCTDASDEKKRFQEEARWMQEKATLHQSGSGVTLELSTCHSTSSFVCLSPHFTRKQFICLNQSQLGDNTIDCLGAIDERNTLPHCWISSEQLGHHFLCPSTNHCISFWHHCQDNYRCPNRTDDDHWCSRSVAAITASRCAKRSDFICFNGTCINDARCNKRFQCPFGEDEYMCDYLSVNNGVYWVYRSMKELRAQRTIPAIRVPVFPDQLNSAQLDVNEIILPPRAATPLESDSSSLTPYWCNRGLAILSTNNHSIVCFCPPQYYGDFCEYHAARLLLLLHLNLSQSIYTPQTDPSIVIKLLVLLLFEDQVLTTQELHLRPASEITTFAKKTIHLPYSRSPTFRQHRQDRFNNRSDILHSHPFAVRIEAYKMDQTDRLALMAVWHYPIIFDHLPVFRLAKVLHWTKMDRSTQDPCSTRRCPPNARCHSLMNDHSQAICLCNAGFIGENCTIRDEQCATGYCAPSSLCMPSYRSLLRGNVTPYCICPFNRFGDRCEIIHDYCQPTSCRHGGTCHPTSQPDRVFCVCPNEYRGSNCETMKPHVRLSLIDRIQYAGAVVQYFQIDLASIDLLLVRQQAYRTQLPRSIQYHHDGSAAPPIIVAKTYDSYDGSLPHIYLLSVVLDVGVINGTTEMSKLNECQSVHHTSNVSSPIQYHQVCIDDASLLCFRDDTYLCICGTDHTHVECFLYDDQLDRCSHCLSGGRCLRGDHNQSNDFVCLCPRCYSGRRCQFNSKSFAFTLDQLLYTDLTSRSLQGRTSALLIFFSLLAFLVAMPNNLFCFITFRRPTCLRNGVGHYLLCLSVANQVNLGLLLARLLHIILGLLIHSSHFTLISDISCKVLTYSLSCCTRVSLWLATFVALERVYTTMFLTSQWFKQPHIARRLIIITFSVILLSAADELVFTRSFSSMDERSGVICVTEFPLRHQSLWTIVHQIISIAHFICPLVINLCCTCTIITLVIRTKMNLHARRTPAHNTRPGRSVLRDVLNENKELIARPTITLIPSLFSLFSLPLFIVALSLACQNLEQHPLRYLLLAFYLLTFIPSMITFVLYIYPSSLYWEEWRATTLGQRLVARRENRSKGTVATVASTLKNQTKRTEHQSNH